MTPGDVALATIGAAVLKVNPLSSKYLRRDVTGDGIPESYCNIYVRDLLAELGLPIPALRANDLSIWFESATARHLDWLECSAEYASVAAGAGRVVVPVWFNPKGHPGHIVLMVGRGQCTQAGRVNFKSGKLSDAFSQAQLAQVRYFHHSLPFKR